MPARYHFTCRIYCDLSLPSLQDLIETGFLLTAEKPVIPNVSVREFSTLLTEDGHLSGYTVSHQPTAL